MIRAILTVIILATMGVSFILVASPEPKLIPCTTDMDCMVKNPHIDY